jgi:hypothetical protein
METVLEKFTTKEQNYNVCFLWARGLNTKDTDKEIVLLYQEVVVVILHLTAKRFNRHAGGPASSMREL